MKQVILKGGQIIVDDVPSPGLDKQMILVRVSYSCVSIGTEISGIKATKESLRKPLLKKALERPELAKKAFEIMRHEGISATINKIRKKESQGKPLGYSAAGKAIGVGQDIKDISINDRVACAGGGYAIHAEVISVPRNLVVKIPENISFRESSTVTLGAIALQGIRRAKPTLGEWFVVIGLGLIGQITVQLLKANGCRVIGCDPIEKRIEIAYKYGMDEALTGSNDATINHVMKITDSFGADGVIITAASSSNDIVSMAFNMCRKKGRVVFVGKVGLKINRDDMYKKELDFLASTAYGPGRYESKYEEKGLDYPIGYVRWTENRNMQEYLRLISEKRINILPLIENIYPIDKAVDAYESLKDEKNRPLSVVFEYPELCGPEKPSNTIDITGSFRKIPTSKKVRIALIGASSFAKRVHLPNLKKLARYYDLIAVMSKTGYNAKEVAQKYGALFATTDYNKILKNKNINAVLIATRHNLHTELTIKALKAGKHVLVEKPLAICWEELQNIVSFYKKVEHGNEVDLPLLHTGFNRRFSPFMKEILNEIQNRKSPLVINYRMNVEHRPSDHWTQSEEGGGRNIGEACHAYDTFTFLTNSRFLDVSAKTIKPNTSYYLRNDNFVATVTFDDGSVANLIYTTLGTSVYSKDLMEIYVDGKIILLDDYKEIKIIGGKNKTYRFKNDNKGYLEELNVFANALIKGRNNWPIPLWQQIQATEISLLVEDIINK